MGKNLIQQKRGKGSSTYRRHSFRAVGKARVQDRGSAIITDIVHSKLHTAPIAKVCYEDGEEGVIIAPEGVCVGQRIVIGSEAPLELGNTLPLKNLPEGSLVYNIEAQPGDGGKFVRASGGVARIVGKSLAGVIIQLPSKKRKTFNPACKASLGVAAGGGRREKPFMKAGRKHHYCKAKNKYWPKVSGAAMNAVDHPLGGKRSGRKGRPTIVPKNAPPGRKVGMLRPRHTGRNK
ncbi:50S ribosomal protein L2 [Candidatus Woesearchaeota archaeon]|nr:MAG: 50S ribosomal protein L2 [Candidatus Woesearchaeota archaeon]